MKALARVVVVLTAAALVAGCGGGGHDKALVDAPIVQGKGSNTECLPTDGNRAFTIGLDVLVNTAHAPVQLKAARLVGAVGLDLQRAFVTPLVNDETVGVHSNYPPRDLTANAAADWSARRPLGGAKVGAKEAVGLVLVVALQPGATKGTARSVEVDYATEAPLQHYQWHSAVATSVRPSCFAIGTATRGRGVPEVAVLMSQ